MMRWLWSEACKERVGGYYIVGKNEREIQPEIQLWNSGVTTLVIWEKSAHFLGWYPLPVCYFPFFQVVTPFSIS